jgi:hypothetical protein
MKIAIEVTSILQIIFSLALLEKKYMNEDNLKVDLLFLNNHVNDKTINFASTVMRHYNYTIKIYDYRGSKQKDILRNRTKYECLIVRTRLQLTSHDSFLYSKDYFKSTGNCNNSKLVQSSFSYKNIWTTEDGLSNWKINKSNHILDLLRYLYIAIRHRKILAIPVFLRKVFPIKNYVNHFSIFSKFKQFSIKDEFLTNIQRVSSQYEVNYDIEDLFIGIWPEFENDRSSTKNVDIQMKYFSEFIKNNHSDYQERKYFIKEHPKWNLELDSFLEVNFVKLEEVYTEAPLEVIINRFPNLKNIYGFPSTSYYLMNLISDKDVNVNIFVKEEDSRYFPERVDLIEAKNININKIYV